MNDKIDVAMEEAVIKGVFPAAALLVGHQGNVLYEGYYGKAKKNLYFDIASLTKPLATATLLMQLVEAGTIKLNDTLSDWLSLATGSIHKQITLEHLLTHTSGLPSWRPLYREIPKEMIGTEEAKRHIISGALQEPIFAKPGTLCEYSDLGYILLGAILEEATQQPLSQSFDKKIATPLGIRDTFYLPLEKKVDPSKFLPTEDCPWRGWIVQGAVHDYNAYAMGGVAGHAGLFATVSDLHLFVIELLKCYQRKSFWIHPDVVRRFINPEKKPEHGTFVLGWDTPHFAGSSSGSHYSPNSIGHLGYTGCSIWIDLEKEFWVILLSNRVHPSVTNTKIKSFRPRIHNLVWKEFLA